MKKDEIQLEKTHDYCSAREPKLTVVMIHGIASDSSAYDNALEHLEADTKLNDVRFVTFDLLGSGRSAKNDSFNYDYDEQLQALQNSLRKLNIKTPLILVGHSLGTFIVTRYTSLHKDEVFKLVLISPPVYTKSDLSNPVFVEAAKQFKNAVTSKNKENFDESVFDKSMENIVFDENNFNVLAEIRTPTTMIYGQEDQIIASYNYPQLLKKNPDYLTAISTDGKHGVTKDKYTVLSELLEGAVDA